MKVLVERDGLHVTVRPEPCEGFDAMKCHTTTGFAFRPFAALRVALVCVSLAPSVRALRCNRRDPDDQLLAETTARIDLKRDLIDSR